MNKVLEVLNSLSEISVGAYDVANMLICFLGGIFAGAKRGRTKK